MSDNPDHTDQIDYVRLTREAHVTIVREALRRVETDGALPGEHHFYISFRTTAPGIRLSDNLRRRFPEEMTIVIQNQYWDLRVDDEAFEIVLKFNSVPEQLRVPFASIARFVDPCAEFSLVFIPPEASAPANAAETELETEDEKVTSGEVVSLSAFRDRN